MNCPNCETNNEQNAKYCINCGTDLQTGAAPGKGRIIDIFVFIALAYWLASHLINALLQRLVENWWDSPVKYVQIFFNLVFALMPIVFALSIKNKVLKIIGIILAGLITISLLTSNLLWLGKSF
jgi:hypothetical protein